MEVAPNLLSITHRGHMKLLATIIISLFFLSACSSKNEQSVAIDKSTSTAVSVQEDIRSPYNLIKLIPISEMTDRADIIVYGRVTNVTGGMTKLDSKINVPISSIDLVVSDVWKGDETTKISFKSYGADIDGSSFYSEEFPRFVVGDHVVLFLKHFTKGLFPVAHIQGCYFVKNGQLVSGDRSVLEFKNMITDYMDKI